MNNIILIAPIVISMTSLVLQVVQTRISRNILKANREMLDITK